MNPSPNGANVRRAPLAEAATQVCLGLLVVLATTAFSGTLFAQSPEKPKRNLLFIGQAIAQCVGYVRGFADAEDAP